MTSPESSAANSPAGETPPSPTSTGPTFTGAASSVSASVFHPAPLVGTPGRLRFWPLVPAAVVFALSLVLPQVWPNPGLVIGLIGVVGPMLAALLVTLWWLLGSRAPTKEKLLAVVALLALAGVFAVVSDPSTRQTVFFTALPWATGLFALVQWLLRGRRHFSRSVRSVLATLVAFLPCPLLRNEGVSGSFDSEFQWRWQPRRSEAIVETLKQRGGAVGATDAAASWSAPTEIAWPQFRGPQRDGKVPGVVLNPDWKAHPPRELWRIPVGPGWGSFCIAGDRLFTQEQRGDQEVVAAYHTDTGAAVWVRETPGMFDEPLGGPGPRATPTWHRGRLYVQGALGNIACLDPATGHEIWSRSLVADSGAQPPQWGFSSSPLGVADRIVCYAGGQGARDLDSQTQIAPHAVVAYDAGTGEIVWRAPAGGHSYSSPQWLEETSADPPAILMLTDAGLTALDPATGATRWSHAWPFPGYRVVQPTQVGPRSFLLGTTMGVGTQRIEVTAAGVQSTWTSTEMRPYFNDFIEHEGALYGFDHNIFACLDLQTGERRWKGGRYGNGQVLLLPEGQQLLVVTEQTGDLVLLAAEPTAHRELGRIPVLSSKTWNHPALVGQRIYLRNRDEAVCLELTLAE